MSPITSMMRFEKRVKIRVRYIGPFEIIGIVGEVFYDLALPSDISVVNQVFYLYASTLYFEWVSLHWDSVD